MPLAGGPQSLAVLGRGFRRGYATHTREEGNCFSSELLVPAEWAIAEYRDQPTVEDTVDVITRKYQVTKTLAALQLLTYNHSNWGTLGENDRTVLEKISH